MLQKKIKNKKMDFFLKRRYANAKSVHIAFIGGWEYFKDPLALPRAALKNPCVTKLFIN